MTTPATASVKGGFYPENGVSSLASISGKANRRRIIAQALGVRGLMKWRALWDALTGAAAGGAALKQLTRIAAAEELGGVRTVETVDLVNRVTTAADDTEITADFLTFSTRTYDPTPVPNLDGNPLGTR